MERITYSGCPCCGAATISPKLSVKDYTVSGERFAIWECAACTARFTQDIPTQSEIGRYYQAESYISHTDTNKGIVNSLYHLIRKRTLLQKKRLIERVTGMTTGRVLDIGAGTGAFAAYMHNAGWKVSALEPDEGTRQRAFSLYGLSLDPSTTLFELPAASFDIVTMWHVLEHVHALREYLDQIQKILKKDGKAFIAVPNYTSKDAAFYGEYWAAYDVPRHLYHFSPVSMQSLLQQHGLLLTDKRPMWFDGFYVSLLSEQYKRGSAHYFRALGSGLSSFINTLQNTEKCSSLIYIIERHT